jgi:hypothetical protein
MTYWRMQLHPEQPGEAFRHAVESVAAGHIGLDFESEIGDLRAANKADLPTNQKDYWAFAHEMEIGDPVLVIVHHFPFALVTVSGDYNYIRRPAPELRVWFRHFRSVKNVRYYADFRTNAAGWEQFRMTDTISPLRSTTSKSYLLIKSWING